MKVMTITGGPCAGKTSAMDVLRERFECAGVRAVFIPEAATDLINAGVAPWTCPSMLEFQTRVIALQIEREAEALRRARATHAAVVICDRGLCDSRTYPFDAEHVEPPARGPILVSACLLGKPCRYDGKALPCPAVIELAATREVVPVCPEQLGGLPTPRTPSEIRADGHVVDKLGADRTFAFETGARETLRIAREHGCTKAILKENSPSCGSTCVYDGTFNGTLIPGRGKTAAILAEAGIEVLSEHQVDCV